MKTSTLLVVYGTSASTGPTLPSLQLILTTPTSSYLLFLLALHYRDYRVYVGVYIGLYWDNGKENGNYYSIIGYILGV